MDESIASIKLNAFLHDFIYNVLILMQNGYSHQQKATELANYLGINLNEAQVKAADVVASGSDGLIMPTVSNEIEAGQVRFMDNPTIVHPMSGVNKRLDINSLDSMLEAVERAFRDIGQKMKGHTKEELYLYIWRMLLPGLEKETPTEMRKYWRFIPSDTRIPDHTIWDHMDMTAVRSLMDYTDGLAFVLMDIGPVQSFIEQARKTSDLWLGSYIISYLNWIAMKPIVEAYGPDSVVFPKLWEQPFMDRWLKEEKRLPDVEPFDLSMPTLTNRFLAILPSKDAKSLAEKGKQAVQAELVKMGDFATKQWPKNNKDKYIEDQCRHQMLDAFNIYYTILTWPTNGYAGAIELFKSYNGDTLPDYFSMLGNGQNIKNNMTKNNMNIDTVYELVYTMAEKSMAARKNIRNFAQCEEPGIKCSVCGTREVLHPADQTSYEKIRAFWSNLASRKEYEGKLAPGERLCALCFVKRMGDKYFELGTAFPSVSDIATAYFKVKAKDYFNIFYNEFSAVLGQRAGIAGGSTIESFDGEFLYQETLTPRRFEKDYNVKISMAETERLQKTLKELYDKAGFAPSRYYAVLCMDGDDMGKWLAGANAPALKQIVHPDMEQYLEQIYGTNFMEAKRPMHYTLHSAISSSLRDYSIHMAKSILEQRAGSKLIYAGGDDVLALVSLRDLPSVMISLRAYFSGHVNSDGQPDFDNDGGWIEKDGRLFGTMGQLATASMGVAIAHYKQPLQLAIAGARDMERWAKGLNGKNAFAIQVMKRSGEVCQTRAKWYYVDDGRRFNVIARCMIKMSDLFKQADISSNFLYTLKQELNGFGSDTPTEMFAVELNRLLKRSVVNDEQIEWRELSEDIGLLLSSSMSDMSPKEAYENLLNFMEIAYFISKER